MQYWVHRTYRSLWELFRNQNLLTVEDGPEVPSTHPPLLFKHFVLNDFYLDKSTGLIWSVTGETWECLFNKSPCWEISLFICLGAFCEIRKEMVAITLEQQPLWAAGLLQVHLFLLSSQCLNFLQQPLIKPAHRTQLHSKLTLKYKQHIMALFSHFFGTDIITKALTNTQGCCGSLNFRHWPQAGFPQAL